MADISSQINELIKNEVAAQVAAETAKYKNALQEAIGILQAVAGEPDKNRDLAERCASCGKPFIKKTSDSHFCADCQAPDEPLDVSTPKKSSQVVEKPVKADPPQSTTSAASENSEKFCASCGEPFTATTARSKYCKREDCVKKRNVHNYHKYKATKSHLDEPVEAPAESRREDKPASTAPITPDTVTHYQPMPGGVGRRFTDLWDCQACRDYEQPCRLHKTLEAEGKRPMTGKGVTIKSQ